MTNIKTARQMERHLKGISNHHRIEILLLVAFFLVPWVFALPFYGLELLVGFVQALIFAGLTLIFLTVAVSHHGAEAT